MKGAMFNNIFKKFNKNPDGSPTVNGITNGPSGNGKPASGSSATSGDVHRMGQSLQKKFARGIQYNMKIVIRGDRNVGKTCLFHRLQGDKFHEDYRTTDEIQVTSIQWNYNATDDVVKVEIWDVVDKGKRREPNRSVSGNLSKDKLKLVQKQQQVLQKQAIPDSEVSKESASSQGSSLSGSHLAPALDAEFVDVYKNAHGAIFVFDMTKIWTFEYIQRELPKVPGHLPVMILANHRDMGHHRVVSQDQVYSFIETIIYEQRQNGTPRIGEVRYTEASMRNGFGLRYLYKFFNLPFLHLQKQTLERQLERNARELKSTELELDSLHESDENNYDLFLEMVTNRRRQAADSVSALNKSSCPDGNTQIPVREQNGQLPRSVSHSSSMNSSQHAETPVAIVKPTPSIIIGANNPLPAKFQQQFAANPKPKAIVKSATIGSSLNDPATTPSDQYASEFEPEDENMFRKFLDEPSVLATFPEAVEAEESDDEDSEFNHKPMVAKYQEDLDPEDLESENNIQLNSDFKPEVLKRTNITLTGHDYDELKNKNSMNPTTKLSTQRINETLNDYEILEESKIIAEPKEPKNQIQNSKKISKNKSRNHDVVSNNDVVKPKKTGKKNKSTKPKAIKTEDMERRELEAFLGGPLEDSFVTPSSVDYEKL